MDIALEKLQQQIENMVQLTPQEWAAFRDCWKLLSFKRQEYLVREGQTERYLYFVVEGIQRLYFLNDGNEICLGFSFDHSFSGVYDSFVSQTPSQYYLQAITPSKLLALSYTDLEQLYATYPIFERWGRLFNQYFLLGRVKRERDMMSMTAEERYVRLMTESPRTLQLIPHKYLASYLGMSAETFSRVRKRLSKS
ncbi:MAG: Crp/Fnr family transcriptional regulator [Aureispira sp.]|nr:Crp/Fnr family transcriptional regulator [Aureispira sp.]